MAVTLTQLVAFLTVVRRGSVTAAAEELVVTQPSVSAAVSALERELGVELTERAGRTLRPTAAGAAYVPYASDVLGLLEQGARAARAAAELEPHTLRVSAVTTAGEYLLPQLIQAFRERHPDVEISLDVGNRDVVFQRLLDHKVDVAITGRIPDDERLVGRELRRERVRPHHRRGRPAGEAALGRGRGAERASLASARAGLGHTDAVRGIPRKPRHCADRAHAWIERRDQAGLPGGSGARAPVTRGRGARARDGGARDDLPARGAPAAALARGALRRGPGAGGH